jgi:hypothetical protein
MIALVFLVLCLFPAWFAAYFVSAGFYRHLVRTGYAHPTLIRVVSFVASFIVVFFILGCIALSAFRFQR